MKKTIALLAALLMLLCLVPASAQTGMLPLYECYPATGDGNAWFEVPTQYEYMELPMSYTCGYIVDPYAAVIETHMCVYAHIPEDFRLQRGDMDVTGFAEDGRAVLGGADKTYASTVIERYTISDLLWKKVKKGLSGGRVQSVALRIICDREREIDNFVPEEYWNLEADFSPIPGKLLSSSINLLMCPLYKSIRMGILHLSHQ